MAVQRKYNLTLGELLDRLCIVSMKEVKIPAHKKEYAEEISDLLHDINLLLPKVSVPGMITAEFLRDVIILAQFNSHIWYNEGSVRAHGDENLTDEQLVEAGRKLILTHSINGIRNVAKNRVNNLFGGRLDHKIDCLAASAEHWRPSGY